MKLDFPEVVLSLNGSLEQATEAVIGALSVDPSFELLDTLEGPSDGPGCHFLRAEYRKTGCVFVVATSAWGEDQVLEVLNVLLGLRADPDPPGQVPRFHFYSAEPVPSVLETMFSPTVVADFESRAALAVQFGHMLTPDTAMQIAAVGMFLLADVFALRTSFYAGDAETALAAELGRRLKVADFPEDGAPINTLLSLGIFYGERLREKIPFPSRWIVVEKVGQWPALAFESNERTEDDSSLVMSPVGVVIGAFQNGNWQVLPEAGSELEARCRKQLARE